MLLTEIDHVAIAVRDLDAGDRLLRAGVRRHRRPPRGGRAGRRRGGAAQGRRQLHPADRRRPATTRRSPRFIEKRGEGLHHIGYRVDDCAAALEAMKAAGAHADRRGARPGSRGTTVAFIHPKGSFGTLIELVQE